MPACTAVAHFSTKTDQQASDSIAHIGGVICNLVLRSKGSKTIIGAELEDIEENA